MDKLKKKRILERTLIFCAAILTIGLLVAFLSDVFFPFIRLELSKDFEGAKSLLLKKGFLGFLTVSLIEALQMVVIFIPAEFIQLSSGMAYPWWLAILLCDLGVILGSSLIYFLVNVFRFDGNIFNKQNKIEKYEKRAKTNSVMVLMYLLFIMPIIPFGAICYYGSGKKLPYPKYLLTCATGVIPSIATSILMGAAVKGFIANSLPIWALVLIIIGAATILFTLLVFVLKKFFFHEEKGQPNPLFLRGIEKFFLRLMALKVKFKILNANEVKKIDGPFLYLSNHHSFLDPVAVHKIDPERNYVAVINEYYFRLPVIGKILSKAGHIKKKMFYQDLNCVKRILQTLKKGYPVSLFPEGRLSTDGSPSHINKGTISLCKKVKVPLVFVEIRGNYFLSPKWRSKSFSGSCEVEIKRIIYPEEIAKMDEPSLYRVVQENLSYNEFEGKRGNYPSKQKAKGLENILYLCPHCRSLYSNISNGNEIICLNCKKTYHIGNDYHFEETDIHNLHEYYQKIIEIEKKSIDSVQLDIPVDVKIFKDGVKKVKTEKGIFHLDQEKVEFRSQISDLCFSYRVESLEGIAYSVNQEFELYYNDELYYFYPSKDDKKICTRVALLFEILKGDK